jgi:hypothetical protein
MVAAWYFNYDNDKAEEFISRITNPTTENLSSQDYYMLI